MLMKDTMLNACQKVEGNNDEVNQDDGLWNRVGPSCLNDGGLRKVLIYGLNWFCKGNKQGVYQVHGLQNRVRCHTVEWLRFVVE